MFARLPWQCPLPLPAIPAVPDIPRDQLRDQLQATLGTAYTMARELGGGGMSRVFVADEPRLGRQVVVKVLAPELAAGSLHARLASRAATGGGQDVER